MPKLAHLIVPEYAEFPSVGIAQWKNPGNHFVIFACHDTADPDKRSLSWQQETSRGYTDQRKFDQEHNLSFASWGGKPVYASFDSTVHVAAGRLQYNPKGQMQRWWDMGHHACVWAQVDDGQMRIFDSRQTIGAFGPDVAEYRSWEIEVSGLGMFIERCLEISRRDFPQAQVWRDIIDPSGKNPDTTHERTSLSIFQEHKLRPVLGETQDMVVRVTDVEDWLMFRPGMLIDSQARVVIDGFAGGFKYLKEGVSEKPDWQSGYGHTQSSISYGCSKNRMLNTKHKMQEQYINNLDPARHDLRGLKPERRRRSSSWMGY